jgi:diguanylate cyclase (GGDEF)-like protein
MALRDHVRSSSLDSAAPTRILVADDDADFRQSLQLVLRRWGYQVETVPDGQRAWVRLSADPPDLVLLDWMMPIWSGVEVCRQMAHLSDSERAYAILLSSRTTSEDIAMGLEAGADDYVIKPIDFVELQARVRVGVRMVRLRRQLLERSRSLELRLDEINRLHAEAEAACAREHFLAFHDALTGVANRQLFFDHLHQAIALAHRNSQLTAVFFLDLNNFKEINDSFGHEVGDQVLRSAAHRIKTFTRETDTVARLGGDEFAITAAGLSKPMDSVAIAEKLLQSFSEPFVVDDQAFELGASIGISLYPTSARDVPTLVKQADLAMYRAKRQGKNRFVLYDAEMEATIRKRLSMEHELRKAVAQSELVLHYQPLVNLATRCMIGVEALLRWQRPAIGLMGPEEFIPLAEETGLIVPIGEWALRTACRQSASADYLKSTRCRMSVNLSARQFRGSHLVETVADALECTGLEPPCLELEITESAAMQNLEQSIASMRRLKNMGVRLAVDDFGTGYCSLSYLKRFPIDTLKIDRSFIRGIPRDADDVAITRAIVTLAQNLHVGVLAEGVETFDQCELLTSLGCEAAQGFLFSPAIASDKLKEIGDRQFVCSARQVPSA